MPVLLRKPWQLPKRELTPEKFFRERRQLIKSAGLVGLGAAAGIITACGPAKDAAQIGAQENPPASISIRHSAIDNSSSIVH